MTAQRPQRAAGVTRVAVLQPEVPHYRLPFFDAVANTPGIDLTVWAEKVVRDGAGNAPDWFAPLGDTRRLGPGFDWQTGAARLGLKDLDALVLSASIRTASNFPLALRARRRGIPVIWWGHYHSAGSSERARKIRRIMYRLGNAVLFYTDEEVAQYREDGGAMRAFALNNGIDTREINALRAPYRAADRPARALFVGRLTQKSRFDLLLQAMADPICAGLELSVIGEADPQTRARAEALGCADRILWHGARFAEAEVAEIANQCRLFVYPGAVGLSVVHAMAYGLPALLHGDRRDHMPEIAAFADGVTGRSFAHGDVQDLAAQLAALLADVEALQAQSQAAGATMAQRFNTDAMAERLTSMVQDLVAPPARGRP